MMKDEPIHNPEIHIDSDWKQEAQREKDRLAAQAERERKPEALPEASFVEIVNMIMMQAIVGMGGLQTPGGQKIPPDLELAKHHIDMLEVLDKKTRGNLSPEEKHLLDGVLYELRMRYVDMVTRPGPAPPTPPPGRP